MAVHTMRVAAVAAVLALSAVGFADDVDQSNPDTKALLEYVKKLEGRVNQLEQEKQWPLDEVRSASSSALEAAVRSVNISGYMEFQYAYNLRHGGTHVIPGSPRGDTLAYSPNRGAANDDNGFSFQNVQVLVDKPLAAMNSTGFRVRAEFGEVSRFDNRDFSFTDTAHAFDVREAFMSWRMETGWGLTNYVDLSVGKMDSPIGLESPDAPNPNNYGLVTRGAIRNLFTPVTHTGIRAVFPWMECAKTSIYFVNGWDNVRDAADGKTGIISHEMGPFEWLNSTVIINASYGNEGNLGGGAGFTGAGLTGFSTRGSTTGGGGTGVPVIPGTPLNTGIEQDGDKTALLEVIWKGKIDDANSVALDGMWERRDHGTIDAGGFFISPGLTGGGTTKGGGAAAAAGGSTSTQDVYAIQGYYRHDMSKTMWVSGRLGYYRAAGGRGIISTRVADASVAVGWNLADDLSMALEYRHDHAFSNGQPFFTSSGNANGNQDTITASFVYQF